MEPVGRSVGETGAGDALFSSVKAEVSGGKQVEVVLTKPDKDFQDVKVIAFPSIGKKTTRLSAANTKVTSAMSLQI